MKKLFIILSILLLTSSAFAVDYYYGKNDDGTVTQYAIQEALVDFEALLVTKVDKGRELAELTKRIETLTAEIADIEALLAELQPEPVVEEPIVEEPEQIGIGTVTEQPIVPDNINWDGGLSRNIDWVVPGSIRPKKG